MFEMQLFSAGVNVALNGTAKQSSIFDRYQCRAAAAIDVDIVIVMYVASPRNRSHFDSIGGSTRRFGGAVGIFPSQRSIDISRRHLPRDSNSLFSFVFIFRWLLFLLEDLLELLIL